MTKEIKPECGWGLKDSDKGPPIKSNFFAQDLSIAQYYLAQGRPSPLGLDEVTEALLNYPLTVLNHERLMK
jgi:hypothetical protein